MKIRILLIMGLVLAGVLATGCSGEAEHEDMSEAMFGMPEYVHSSPPVVQESYVFAAENPEMLMYQPCYCGCGNMGHTNNLDCFVKEFRIDGAVVYDNHAAGCGICVDIAQDVMRLSGEGMSQPDIRAYIDARYGSFGPSTDTPLPPEA